MAFLALRSSNILHCNTIHFVVLYIIVKFFIDTVKFVTGTVCIVEVNMCGALAVDAQTHA